MQSECYSGAKKMDVDLGNDVGNVERLITPAVVFSAPGWLCRRQRELDVFCRFLDLHVDSQNVTGIKLLAKTVIGRNHVVNARSQSAYDVEMMFALSGALSFCQCTHCF